MKNVLTITFLSTNNQNLVIKYYFSYVCFIFLLNVSATYINTIFHRFCYAMNLFVLFKIMRNGFQHVYLIFIHNLHEQDTFKGYNHTAFYFKKYIC